MSLAVLRKTQQSIDLAFETQDSDLLEKETQFLLYSLGDSIPDTFSNSVRFVGLRKTKLKAAHKLMSERHKIFFHQVLELLDEHRQKQCEFRTVKFLFDKLFLETTEEGYIEYEYDMSALVSAEEASEILGVSKPTVYKYMDKGLEYKEINNVKKIPRAAIELWSDPSIAFELQWIHQQNKIRKQTLEEKFEFVQRKITEYEIEFEGEFDTLYGHLTVREIDGLDEAVDVFEWKEYIDQKNALFEQLKAKRGKKCLI